VGTPVSGWLDGLGINRGTGLEGLCRPKLSLVLIPQIIPRPFGRTVLDFWWERSVSVGATLGLVIPGSYPAA
jgi:hypothetical protein